MRHKAVISLGYALFALALACDVKFQPTSTPNSDPTPKNHLLKNREFSRGVGEAGGVDRNILLPPTPSNPRNSEGDFVKLNDGRLMFVYTRFTGGHGDHDSADLAARFSSDAGITWSKHDRIVVPNEGSKNVMSVSMVRLGKGDIALFYLVKNSLNDTRPVVRFSDDDGETWSEPTKVVEDNELGYYVLNNDRVVQLRNGRLVVPVSQHSRNGSKWTKYGRMMTYLSDDNGRTWRRSQSILEPPAGPRGRVVLQEPGIVELQDGKLLMFMRTNAGTQYYAYSNDRGDKWTNPKPSNIISPLSPASIERIPHTGDLLLLWNNNALDNRRTPYTVAISQDDSVTWTHVGTLEDDPKGWYCYTAMEFIGDRIILGHVAGDGDGNKLGTTQITSFNADWLYKTIR